MIDSDPNMLVAEAEKQIARIATEKATLARRIEFERQNRARANRPDTPPPAREPFEARVARLLAELKASRKREALLGSPRGMEAALAYPASPRYVSRSAKSPCLSIPLAGNCLLYTSPSPRD